MFGGRGGSFDVWLRKMHVEGKRWGEGALNKIKKKSYRGSGVYFRYTFLIYKSDVPDPRDCVTGCRILFLAVCLFLSSAVGSDKSDLICLCTGSI